MKRLLAFIAVVLLTAGMAQAQQLGVDAVVGSTSIGVQQQVKTTTAFNGWIYAAYNANSPGSGGITIKRSIDGGGTWTLVDQYDLAGKQYPTFDLVVTGNDTASLVLSVVGVATDGSTSWVLYVDRYDGNSGVFLGQATSVSSSTRLYGVGIASDYRVPGVGTAPYSVAVAYSQFSSSMDSINYLASLDGGATYSVAQPVATTASYYRNVSIAYGRSESASNGRYFIAWDQFADGNDANGALCESRNASTVSGAFITPVTVNRAPGSAYDPCPPSGTAPIECPPDDLTCPAFPVDAAVEGHCRSPSLAVQYNNTDNVQGSTTAVLMATCDYTAGAGNVIGFYNLRSHFTSYWGEFTPAEVGTGDQANPDVAYDTYNASFLLSYLDRDNSLLPYKTNDMNLATPNAWALMSTNYADLNTGIDDAMPNVDYSSLDGIATFAWINHGAAQDVAYFDGGDRIFADGFE